MGEWTMRNIVLEGVVPKVLQCRITTPKGTSIQDVPVVVIPEMPPGVALMGYPGGPKAVMDLCDVMCADQEPIKEASDDAATT